MLWNSRIETTFFVVCATSFVGIVLADSQESSRRFEDCALCRPSPATECTIRTPLEIPAESVSSLKGPHVLVADPRLRDIKGSALGRSGRVKVGWRFTGGASRG